MINLHCKMLCLMVVFFLVFCLDYALAQTTNYVAATGSDTNAGTFDEPYLTISNAVLKSASGDTVLVFTGVYCVATNIVVNKHLILRSWNMGNEDRENTIIDGGSNCAVLYINHNNALVGGFTVANGNGAGNGSSVHGGGVYLNAGTLSNCIVIGNTALREGAGIYMGDNSVVVDCLVKNNIGTHGSLSYGGGLSVGAGARVLNTTIVSNFVQARAGGVYLLAGTVVSNCLIAGNKALLSDSGVGGGVRVEGTNVLIVGAVVSNNYAGGTGGGISLAGSNYVVLRDSTLTANEAKLAGGGIQLMRTTSDGGALISNCVISYNVVTNTSYCGGGIADGYFTGATSTGRLMVVNSKLIGNEATYGGGAWIYTYGAATFYNCEIIGNIAGNGAGLYVGTGSAHVVAQNCLIVSNQAFDGCGIMFGAMGANSGIEALDVCLASCTIVDNTATRDYGGMNIADGLKVWNTIIVSNQAARYYPDLRGGGTYIAPFRYSCSPVLTNTENSNKTGSPSFVAYPSGNYRLQAGSPCINTGTNMEWMTEALDLDGCARIDRFSGKVDMGVYEFIQKGVLFFGR